MPLDHPGDAFSFINEPRHEPLLSRQAKRSASPGWGPWLLGSLGSGAALVGLLIYAGLITVARPEATLKKPLPPLAVSQQPAFPQVAPRGPAASGRTLSPPRVSQVPARPPQANRPKFGSAAEPVRPVDPKSLRKARNTPDPEPAPARLGSEEAVAKLEAKGITRGGSGFVLTSESVATSKLTSLRSRAAEFNQADQRVAAINQTLAYLRELDQAIINIKAEIANLAAAMSQYPAVTRRGVVFHGYNNIQNDEFEAFKAQKINDERVLNAELIPRRDTMRADQPGRQLGEATNDLKKRREAAVEALGELQEAIASTKSAYSTLANDSEVKRALTGLGQAGLEPSREFVQIERECQEFERSAAQMKLTTRP